MKRSSKIWLSTVVLALGMSGMAFASCDHAFLHLTGDGGFAQGVRVSSILGYRVRQTADIHGLRSLTCLKLNITEDEVQSGARGFLGQAVPIITRKFQEVCVRETPEQITPLLRCDAR